MKINLCLLLIVILFTACSQGRPNNNNRRSLTGKRSSTFSQWRGDTRSGVYDEPDLMHEWPKEGPPLIWSVKDLPTGFSSVSVANNLIYLTGLKDTLDYIIALDMNGGKKWEAPIGAAWMNSFPDSRSTPTVEGERVYVTSGKGHIAAFNSITGEEIWNINGISRFEGRMGTWGCAESPLIVDDKVIFSPSGEKTAVVALNKFTGETVWKSESLRDTAAYVSPILVEEGGRKLVIAVTSTFVVVLDAATGEILCSSNYAAMKPEKSLAIWLGGPYTTIITPLYRDRKIFISGGYDHPGAMYTLSDDSRSLTLDWTNEVLDIHHGGAVLVDGYIYGSNWINNSKGRWCCLDWNTGETMYEHDWRTKGSVISSGGILYILEERSGWVAMVKASPEGFNVISEFPVKEGSGPYWAHPVICDRILFIRHGDALCAYDISQK